MVTTLRKCRICGSSRLKLFLDLGKTPLANAFVQKKDIKDEEQRYPLRVLFCETCNLCQLQHIIDPQTLFSHYVYFSSPMPQLSGYFSKYIDEAITRFIPSKKGRVVEIGSNDGILLAEVKKYGIKVLGVDPAKNIALVANVRGIPTIPDFFSNRLAHKIVKTYGRANMVIANNVVAHINDHHDLIQGVKTLLHEDGVFIFEAPYLIDMFTNLSFDTIYHEHLSYLAVRPLMMLMDKYDMEIFDVQAHHVQGLSLRVFVGNRGKHKVSNSVSRFIEQELAMGLNSLNSYKKLAKQIASIKNKARRVLYKLKCKGSKISAYGAPAKGNTLLNYYDIGRDVLDYATEELPSKIGMFTPGTHIPIIDIKNARKIPPDFFLLLAWNYKDAILKKEEKYLTSGGKFIIPIGKVEIVS